MQWGPGSRRRAQGQLHLRRVQKIHAVLVERNVELFDALILLRQTEI